MISLFPGVFVLIIAVSRLLFWRPTARIVTPGPLARARTGIAAILLAGMALVCMKLLVADAGDDAYLDLALFGAVLLLPEFPLALATAMPDGGLRRFVLRVALVLLAVIGIYALLVVLPSFVRIATRSHRDSHIAGNHLVGAILLVLGLAALALALWRPPGRHQRQRQPPVSVSPVPERFICGPERFGCSQSMSHAEQGGQWAGMASHIPSLAPV